MRFPRRSGILCHPTSFPCRYGIGDFGQSAYDFIDFLEVSGQKIWQVLPLGPTGYGDSPYQCFSAFAGNHLFISPDKLNEKGLLSKNDLTPKYSFNEDLVDYGGVIDWKNKLLRSAFFQFKNNLSKKEESKFNRFCKDNKDWLENYALFMSVKGKHGQSCWDTWETGISEYKPDAIHKWKEELKDEIYYQKWLQYTFFGQWSELKYYANEKKIKIVGDLPIFVAYDSADVWCNPELFLFSYIAGVPPDYFSATGQLWGNPQYNWEKMRENNFRWWRMRFLNLLKMVDIIRIDHFRGFSATWHIPYGEDNAIKGSWIKSPGKELFEEVFKSFLGEIPIIAENLGVITQDVENLRDSFDLPGMKVLQFAFDDPNPENVFLPHNYGRNNVVYTGTHDNDTTVGWFNSADEKVKKYALDYLNSDGKEIHWDFIRGVLSSAADTCIIPLQDVLGLGSESRMNYPSRESGNWQWRFRDGIIDNDEIKKRLKGLTSLYGRLTEEPVSEEETESNKYNKE